MFPNAQIDLAKSWLAKFSVTGLMQKNPYFWHLSSLEITNVNKIQLNKKVTVIHGRTVTMLVEKLAEN